jgi:hypothetical protein
VLERKFWAQVYQRIIITSIGSAQCLHERISLLLWTRDCHVSGYSLPQREFWWWLSYPLCSTVCWVLGVWQEDNLPFSLWVTRNEIPFMELRKKTLYYSELWHFELDVMNYSLGKERCVLVGKKSAQIHLMAKVVHCGKYD